jgi:MFS family permease
VHPSQVRKLSRIAETARVFRTVFANRDLRRLELAFVGFSMAEWGTWVAILVFAYDHGGATEAGVVALIQLIPAAIVAPFASSLGDRHPRAKVLLVTYAIQTAAMTATGAAILVGTPPPLTYALAAAAATSITLTRPAQGALLPSLSRTPEELTAANVTAGSIENFALLTGPAVAGLLLGASGAGSVFLVMGGGLFVSTLLVTGLREVGRPPARPAAGLMELVTHSLGGFRSLAVQPKSRLVVGFMAARSILVGSLDVLTVVMAIALLGLGRPGAGYLTSAVGAGGMIGGFAALAMVGRRRLSPFFTGGIILWGLPLAAIALFPRVAPAFTLLVIAGSGLSLTEVAGRTLLQRIVPDDVLSRVFGVLEAFNMAALAVGSIAAPGLVAWLGIRGALIATGASLPIVVALAWPRLTRIDATAEVPTRQIELLRGIRMFSPLPVPTLERLASNLIPLSVPSGTHVIREGETGDRFYILSSGTVDVVHEGRFVRTLEPGDHFGEVALLRDVPRTATVTARSQVELFALERSVFMEGVTGNPMAARLADQIARERLPSAEA